MARYTHAIILGITTLLAVHPTGSAGSDAQTGFFERMKALCGSRFEGQSSFPEDPGEAFRDQTLVAHFKTCDDSSIQIPFHVGQDQSRTWIISRVAKGLELKHDHRHPDGTPDEITLYGGTTTTPGTENSQSFPADDHTAHLIPDAATNEWFLTLSPNNSELTYYLERHGQPRFKATLHRVDSPKRTFSRRNEVALDRTSSDRVSSRLSRSAAP